MPKFIIRYTEEVWNRLEVEAENKEEAENIFWGGECDYASAKEIGGEIQGDILIEEVE
jgi:hypothetical protein